MDIQECIFRSNDIIKEVDGRKEFLNGQNCDDVSEREFIELMLDDNGEAAKACDFIEKDGHISEVEHEDDVEVPNDTTQKIIPNVPIELVPYIGMDFENYDDAYKFYNTYARLGGFGVRKQWSRKVKGEICWASFACNKQGFKMQNNNAKVQRIETRCGCLARIIVCYNKKKEKWIVNEFISFHNHYLHSPSKFNMHRSTKWLNSPSKQLMVDKCHRVGLKPSDMIKLMVIDDDIQSLPITKKDVYAYLRRRNKRYNGIDWQTALQYFQKKHTEDSNFYCAIEHDEDNQVCNCFWVDALAREDYLHFGDVISFDTTYKKNQYEMPVAPFIGVNNHGQSILFGCALLGDEKVNSFIWLFKEWLNAMGGLAPKVIFTDQDPAMKIAIEEVFPKTIHRLCIWHIQQKVPKYLSGLYTQYSGFQTKWNEWFHGSESMEDFEEKWYQMLNLFPKMNELKWLQDLWSLRKSWSSHYSPDIFTAVMSTTQRSESMNHVFSSWFNSKMPVSLFMQKFDDMLQQNRQQTKLFDFQMKNGDRPCIYDSELVSHMQDMLTPSIFEKFQQEFAKTTTCHGMLEGVDNDVKTYKVIQMRREKTPKEYIILFTPSTLELSTCKCWLWKQVGIVCAHMLTVYRAECIERLPSKYILKRWTKTAKDDTSRDFESVDTRKVETPIIMKAHILSIKCHHFIKEALKFEESYKEALDIIAQGTCHLKEKNDERCHHTNNISEGVNRVDLTTGMTSGIVLQDRAKVRSKGCGKRIMSGISDKKSSRNCHICHRPGHDARTCYLNPNKRKRQDESNDLISIRKCHFCGGTGHDKRNYEKGKGKK